MKKYSHEIYRHCVYFAVEVLQYLQYLTLLTIIANAHTTLLNNIFNTSNKKKYNQGKVKGVLELGCQGQEVRQSIKGSQISFRSFIMLKRFKCNEAFFCGNRTFT